MKPRTLAVLDAALRAAVFFALCLWAGVAVAFVGVRIANRRHSPAVSTRASAFRDAGWGEAAGDSSYRPTENSMNIDQTFLDALAAVESGGNDAAINFADDAHGRYQICAAYLADANAALGTRYTLAEMHDPDKAARIVTAYLTRYGRAFERRTGHEATAADLARIHNGGPFGAKREATLGYAEKFLAVWRAAK